MSVEKMIEEKKMTAATKLTEETKLFEEKKTADPFIAGFVESMSKTNIEKITKEILEASIFALVCVGINHQKGGD
jgi:hypothetical protein